MLNLWYVEKCQKKKAGIDRTDLWALGPGESFDHTGLITKKPNGCLGLLPRRARIRKLGRFYHEKL